MKNNVSDKNKIIILLSILFLVVFCFNLITPIAYDDPTYQYHKETKEPIKNLSDAHDSAIFMYFDWGGRYFGNLFSHSAFLIPHSVYSLIVAINYVILMLLLAKLVKPDGKISFFIMFHISMLTWFGLWYWGDVFLWLSGTCNYLFTTNIALFFTLIYKKNYKFSTLYTKTGAAIAMFLLGILAGWSNENTGVGLFMIILALWYWERIKHNDKKQIWYYSGVIGLIIGSAFLILAPGNFKRASVFTPTKFEQINFIFKYLFRFLVTTGMFCLHEIATAVYSSLFIAKSKLKKTDIFNFRIIPYLLGILASVYSLLASPTVSHRALYLANLLVIVVLVVIFDNLREDGRIKIDSWEKITRFISILFICSVVLSTYGNARYYIQYNQIEKEIEIQKAEGVEDIIVPVPQRIFADPHKGQYLVPPISDNPNFWVNQILSQYRYNVKSITGVKWK